MPAFLRLPGGFVLEAQKDVKVHPKGRGGGGDFQLVRARRQRTSLGADGILSAGV